MPIYEFECPKCIRRIECMCSIKQSDDLHPLCFAPGCDGIIEMVKVVSRTSFVLAGRGWAADGYSSSKK